jgi:hypothetical protein
LRGLWRSFPLIAGRDAIFTAFMFGAQPMVQPLAAAWGEHGDIALNLPLAVVGAALSHPLDTVATQLQMAHERRAAADVARALVRGGGVRALYKGLHFRIGLFFGFMTAIPRVQR